MNDRERIVDIVNWLSPDSHSMRKENAVDQIMQYVIAEKLKVIDAISEHEGWEESRDFYAHAFGYEPIYVDEDSNIFKTTEFEGIRKMLDA